MCLVCPWFKCFPRGFSQEVTPFLIPTSRPGTFYMSYIRLLRLTCTPSWMVTMMVLVIEFFPLSIMFCGEDQSVNKCDLYLMINWRKSSFLKCNFCYTIHTYCFQYLAAVKIVKIGNFTSWLFARWRVLCTLIHTSTVYQEMLKVQSDWSRGI